MKEKNVNEKSRLSKRKAKSHKLRNILLIVLAFLLVLVGAGLYEYNRLLPKNHFSNLDAVGEPDGSGGTNSPGDSGGSGDSNTPPASKTKQKSGVFNMVLIGSDARKGDSAGHSDSILLINVDLNTHTYNILSIPRDTRVHMDGYGYTKLTSVQYISQLKHGIEQGTIDAVKAISELTGVPINFYAETTYWGLRSIVDAIGGIEMNVPFDVTLTHPWYKEDKNKTIQKGVHHLNGKMVTEIVHERYSLKNSDYGRQKLQEEAMIGIAKKIMQPSSVTKLPALAGSLSDFLLATNMSISDMVSLALGVKGNFHPKKQIHYRQVKGRSETRYDDILKANNSQIVLDPNQLKKVVQKYFTLR